MICMKCPLPSTFKYWHWMPCHSERNKRFTIASKIIWQAECSCEGYPKESFERAELCIEAGFAILNTSIRSRYSPHRIHRGLLELTVCCVRPSAAAKDVSGEVYRGGFRYFKHLNPFSIRPTPNTQGPTRTDSVLCLAECSCEGHPKESFERVELCIEAGFAILNTSIRSRYGPHWIHRSLLELTVCCVRPSAAAKVIQRNPLSG